MVTRRTLLTGLLGCVPLLLVGCKAQDEGDAPIAAPDVGGAVDGAEHPGAALHSVRYYCGGGEFGDSDDVELARGKGGSVVVTRARKESWNAREKRSRATLDESAFDELARIAETYDLRAASEQPDSEIQALDAPTTSVTYAYLTAEGGMDVDNMFTVSDTQELDERQWEGFHAARDALLALVP